MAKPSPASAFIDQSTHTVDLGDGLTMEYRAVGRLDIPPWMWVIFRLGIKRFLLDEDGNPREERFAKMIEEYDEQEAEFMDRSDEADAVLILAGATSPRVIDHREGVPDILPENTITLAHLNEAQRHKAGLAIFETSIGVSPQEAGEVAEEAAEFRDEPGVPPLDADGEEIGNEAVGAVGD